MKQDSYIRLALVVGAAFVLALVFINNQVDVSAQMGAAVINTQNARGSTATAYSATAEYSRTKANSGSKQQYGQISAPNPSTISGEYIVELTGEPLAVKYKELKDQGSGKFSDSAKSALLAHKAKITGQQDAFISALPSAVKSKNNSLSSSKTRRFNSVVNAVVIKADDAEITAIKKSSNVKRVEAVKPVRALLMDSVPLIRAPQVWAMSAASTSLTGTGISIAIIDTGIDYTHPDLGGCYGMNNGSVCKVAGGWDFVNNDADPIDDMGHGTHVAAIAAGKGALKGVAPDATLYAYKVLDHEGSGSSANIIAALERSLDPNGDGDFSDRMDVASLSLGGGGTPDDEMSVAVDNAVAAGVVVTVAAGNWGPWPSSISSPGTARNAITVAASDKSDNIADFSSRGPVKWVATNGSTKYLIKPDVTAPGVNICAARYGTAFPQGDSTCNNDGNHVAISGTSMATPHVAGEAALFLQLHRDWSPAEVKAAVRNATILQNANRVDWGYGRIDALKLAQSQKLPIAQLSPLGVVKDRISITGTALATNFANYKLSYGVGQNPVTFTDLYSSNQPVNNRVLLANLDTTSLSDGQYIIRLTVTDTTGNSAVDEGLLEVKNISIANPRNGDIYKPGKIISVAGSIGGAPLRFSVEYQVMGAASWSTAGVTLSNGGIGGITNAVIATLDTSGFQSNSSYSLRISAYYSNVVSTRTVNNIYFDDSLHAGWPVHIDYDYTGTALALSPQAKYALVPSAKKIGQVKVLSPSELKQQDAQVLAQAMYYGVGFMEPIAADLDKNGKKEVIIVRGGVPPKVQVYNDDGTLLWTRPFGSDDIGGNLLLPVVGDIDGDGYEEIVTHDIGLGSATSNAYAFSRNGSMLWHSNVPKAYQATMLLADLDHNGKNEIVVQGNDSGDPVMYVLDSATGNLIDQWSIPHSTWSGSLMPSPSVGNFDVDDDLEIVSITPTAKAGYDRNSGKWINEAALYVYNIDGSVVTGFPVLLPGSLSSSPVVGDIDADGKEDIIVGLIYASDIFPDSALGGLYAINRSGQMMPGWPVLKGYNFWSTPALSDVNGDGRLEVSSSRLGFTTYLLDYQGNILLGWPTYTGWNDYYSSIMSDVNSDARIDILASAGTGVYGWNKSGATLNGFMKRTETDAQAFASVADITGNGKLNLLASSNFDYDAQVESLKMRGSIYVWDLNSSYASSSLTWPTYMHNNQRTGRYVAVSAGSTTPDIDPSATVVGSSTLVMKYDAGSENVLVARFDVKVNAGSSDQKVSVGQAFHAYFKADAGHTFGGNQQYPAPSGMTDDRQGFYTIPAGSSAVFNVQVIANPKSMFAGAYHGVMEQVRLGGYNAPTYIRIPAPNKTNTLTIIGEVSPYINLISPTSTPSNMPVTLSGVRFSTTGNILTMTGKAGVPYIQTVGSTNNGTTITYIPNVPADDYYIQVKHPVTGMSNGIGLNVTPSTVVKSLTLTLPGPTTAKVGEVIPIKWSSTGVLRLAIDLYDYKGRSKVRAIDQIDASAGNSSGVYNWTVPADIDFNFDTIYTIRVSDASQPTLYKNSQKVELLPAIVAPPPPPPPASITVTAPNGGEQIQVGSVKKITWSSSNVANVYIKLIKGADTHSAITTTIPNQGYFDWTVSASIPEGTDYKVQVLSSDGAVLDTSDGSFSIVPLPPVVKSLTLTLPGPTTAKVGEVIPIKWSSTGVLRLAIDLYDYKGRSKVRAIDQIDASAGNSSGVYNWTVPADIDFNFDDIYTIRISDVDQPTIYKLSEKIQLSTAPTARLLPDIYSSGFVGAVLNAFVGLFGI